MKFRPTIILLIVILLVSQAGSVSRIKDLVDIKGLQDQQIIGYSLVVGLDGTGDSRRSVMTMQAVRNMLMKFGMNVPESNFSMRNAASVIVTADVSPYARVGSRIDVTVSSLGDASSLEGGTLMMTPLLGRDKQVYAFAQGPVSVGGFNIETVSGERYRKNFTLVGRVPGGGIVQKEMDGALPTGGDIELLLREPDFTSAVRIADAINGQIGGNVASPVDPGRVVLTPGAGQEVVPLIAQIEAIEVEADQEARVVINERTGTLVVGQHVKLSPAAVAHGNLTIRIQSNPIVSQPGPFSQGQTVVVPNTSTTVYEGGESVAVLNENASVEDLASMLNNLNVAPRDIIAIFQALKNAGALQAKLVIM